MFFSSGNREGTSHRKVFMTYFRAEGVGGLIEKVRMTCLFRLFSPIPSV